MSIARIAEEVENPSVTALLAAYPTKDSFDAAVRAGKIKPTTEAGIAANIFNRIVTDAMAKQAQPQSTVFQEMTAPKQPMGLAAAAQPQQPQQPQPQGQGLNQVPVPENMFDERRMAGGGIVAFQAGGATPSFADMYSNIGPDLQALAEARRAYMGDFPKESAKDRRRELLAQLAVQFGGTLASTPGSFAEGLGASAKAIAPTVASGLSEMRKDRMARLAAERAEKGKVFEGVLGARQKAAESAAAEARLTKELTSREKTAEADREAKITAANIAAGKQTDMKYYAEQKLAAQQGDKEAEIRVNAIDNYLQQSAYGRNIVAQQQADIAGKRVDVDLYDKAVTYADNQVGPGGSQRTKYSKLQKQDRENAAKGNPTNLAEEFKTDLQNKYIRGIPKPDGQPGAAAPKKPEISGVTGAPEGSSIGQFVSGKGWEVKDKSGKVIGYAQQ